MTTAEVETTKRRSPAIRTDNAATMSAELVEAGSAIAERSIKLARTAAENGLKVTDTLVLGTLSIAEDWTMATPIAGLTLPPVKMARETWTTTREGLRELVAAV